MGLRETYQKRVPRRLNYEDLDITSGLAVSTDIFVVGRYLSAIDILGDSWDTANLTFQASPTSVDSDFMNVYDDCGNEYAVTVAAERHVILNADMFSGIRFLRVRSGTSGTPVAQTAARVLRVWLVDPASLVQ